MPPTDSQITQNVGEKIHKLWNIKITAYKPKVEQGLVLPSKDEKHLRMKGDSEEQNGLVLFLDKAVIIYHQSCRQN